MSDPLLRTQELFKQFGAQVVNANCNLAVEAGEIHALIGPNGAGKTTLIAQVAGMLKPDGGHIFFDGVDITRLPVQQRVQRGLARTFQITSIFPAYSVLDNLALSVQARHGSSFRFWRPWRNEGALFDAAAAVAEDVGLGNRLATVASALSYGEQRQLEVGLALASNAKLLLLDEPMAGMGREETERMVALIRQVSQQTTILLVEHDMDVVFQLADRISVLVYGELIAVGAPEAIRQDPQVQHAYLGGKAAHHG